MCVLHKNQIPASGSIAQRIEKVLSCLPWPPLPAVLGGLWYAVTLAGRLSQLCRVLTFLAPCQRVTTIWAATASALPSATSHPDPHPHCSCASWQGKLQRWRTWALFEKVRQGWDLTLGPWACHSTPLGPGLLICTMGTGTPTI